MLISLYENVKCFHFICLLEFPQISKFQLPSSLKRSILGTRKNELRNSEQSGTRHYFLIFSSSCKTNHKILFESHRCQWYQPHKSGGSSFFSDRYRHIWT